MMVRKYPLNAKENVNASLAFWIAKYLKGKLLVLSTRLVSDMNLYKAYVRDMENADTMDKINVLSSKLLKIGFDNLSPYYRALKMLYNFVAEAKIKNLENIDDDLLTECLMMNSHYANSTKKYYRNVILSFFRFISDNNIEKYNFGVNINIKSITSSNIQMPRFLSKSDLSKINKNLTSKIKPNGLKARFTNARNTLIMKLLIYSGMRSCEIAELKLNDITKIDNYYIVTIYGKCSKYRKIAIKCEKIENELREYMNYREALLPHLKHLFISKKGNRFQRSSIYNVVKSTLKANGLLSTRKNGGHTIRHSFASLIYKESNNLILLQQLLGHSNIETTRIYTHLDERELTKGADYLDAI